jgi:hypothetical protein
MSFKRKGPGVLASGAIGAIVGFAVVTGVIALLAMPASAQTSGNGPAHTTNEFERALGFSYSQEWSSARQLPPGISGEIG